MKTKVENMRSSNYDQVPNQFIITTEEGTFFQSYETVIAHIDMKGVVSLDAEKWNCSVTTSKYRNSFLGETTKETEAKIRSGEYKLLNLN